MEKIIKNKKRFNNILVISSIICSVLFIGLALKGLFPFSFFILTIYIIAMILCYTEMVKKPFKLEVVGQVLKSYKNTIEYKYKDKMEEVKDVIKKLKLIPSATTFNFCDIITDEVEGVNYKSMDLHATHTQSTGKSTTTVTDFKGKVFEVSVPSLDVAYILKEEKWKNTPKGYTFIELEVINFNSKFNLYTTDEHEIFKVFTPLKIQELLRIEQKYDNIMTIVQNNDKLYILLYDREDLFEKIDNPEVSIIEDYKKQVGILKDYLNVINVK